MRINPSHDDVIKWKHFPRYWPFVRGIHRSPVNSPHKGQWRGALMIFLICAFINGWIHNREAGDLRRHRVHYDVIVMTCSIDVNNASQVIHINLLYYHDVCSYNKPWRETAIFLSEGVFSRQSYVFIGHYSQWFIYAELLLLLTAIYDYFCRRKILQYQSRVVVKASEQNHITL